MRLTALSDYERLEAIGLWRRGDAQRREVIVQLGEATLTLRDPRSDMALAHWSLPALVPKAEGYAPGPDSDEVLEIDDPAMRAALDRVGRVVAATHARPWRLRLALILGAVALVGGSVAAFGPGLLARQTAAAVPEAERDRIARLVLSDMAPLTGVPCDGGLGRAALTALAGRLFGAEGPRLLILPDGLSAPAVLPDGTVLLPVRLLSEATPHALAGAALAAATAASPDDSLRAILNHAGPLAMLRQMVTGGLPADSVTGVGEALLRRPAQPDDIPRLLARMEAAGVAPAPYGWWRDPSGETTLPLIEADRSAGNPPPVMTDDDWQAIRTICD